jgi:integrase
MASVELPDFVEVGKDWYGKPKYYYFRRNGRRWRLPGLPLSEEFRAEYDRLLVETALVARAGDGAIGERPADRCAFKRGSFGALINDYLATGEFHTNLKPRTQAEYRRVCEGLQERHGNKPVRLMKRRHIRQMRHEKAETPRAANTAMVKILLNFGIDDCLIEASPAAKMKELKVGEWRAWTDDECAAFEKRWAPGTMQRRAYALALYTGQRLSDLVLMTRAHRQEGLIHVAAQGKTGEELWIPEHSELTAELARGVAGIASLLTTPTQGKPFDPVYFGSWFAEAIDKAGLPDDCVTHGLRKCAARKLSELGCSEDEIKSITGHATTRMIAHYTKSADQRKRARSAMRKWENAK